MNDDPSDHSESNLAVLCFDCHEETQVHGGFGRKLGAAEVAEFRNDWLERVKARRERADEIASAKQAGVTASKTQTKEEWQRPSSHLLRGYIESLPEIRRAAYEEAKGYWNSGVTIEMIGGSHVVLDVAEQVCVQLAAWYPPNHFDNRSAAEFFSDLIATRFRWHRFVSEPDGLGSGGTMIGPIVAGLAMTDAEEMVVSMVQWLGDLVSVDLPAWKTRWDAVATSSD